MSDRASSENSSSEISIRQDRSDRKPPLPKGLIFSFAFLGLALLAAAWFEIATGRLFVIERERQRLEAVAELKSRLLESWLTEREADAVVSARGLAVTMRDLWREDRDPVKSAALVGRAGFLCRTYGYESAELLDSAGRIVLGFPERATPGAKVADPRELTPPAGRQALISFEELSASDWRFRISTALRATDGEPGYGWLVLTMDPKQFVNDLLSSWPGESTTAETLLVRRDGDVVTILGARPSPPASQAILRIPTSETELVAVQGALGHSGPTEGLDYRRRPVLASLRQVPGSPWTLVAKIDRDEVLGHFASVARRMVLALGLIFALSFALGLAVYLSQRRRLTTRLDRANRRFLALFDHADEGVALFGRDGRIVAANMKIQEMLRLGDRKVAGMPIAQFILEEELRSRPVRWHELESRGSISSERRLRRADGEIVSVQLQTVALPDGRFLAIVHDLTESRTTEQRERRAKRIAKLSAWEWDVRTGKLHWDDETFLLFGYDPNRDQATYEAWLARIHPSDRERVETLLPLALADEAVYDFEHRILLPDGRERWVRCVGDVERDENGAALRIEGAIQDLTDQRHAFVALEAARQQLAESQKTEAIGRLAGGIAHDFNNVVGIILGYCELAELELEEEDSARAHLGEISQAARRAGELTRQLLSFARRQPVERRAVAFARLLDEVRKLLTPIVGENIALEISAPADVGAVRADPAQLSHLVLNLAVNARDAMPQGGRLLITARALEIDASAAALRPPLVAGPGIELTVEDTGIGMDAATIKSCFEPFFTTKGLGVGTGLGLSSVKQTLDECGGAIEVESEPGRGTSFRLWFPAVAADATENDLTISTLVRGRGERILVVDDQAQMREVARSVLVRAGFRVTAAESPEAALAQLEDLEQKFDLLLTDIIMPGLDGRTLAQRALQLRPGLLVLFMTGYADLPPSGVPYEMAPEMTIEKPFAGGALARKVHAALARRDSAVESKS